MKNTLAAGATLAELIIALSLCGILATITIAGSASLRDRSSVRAASTELASALHLARSSALAESRIVALRFDTTLGRALVLAHPDTLLDLPLGVWYAVTLSATRDSIAYGPTGRGYGAANTTLTIRRRGAEDTIVVSRLGRVKS